MLNVSILHGPNLNLLGTRQPDIYGGRSFEDFLSELEREFPQVKIKYAQTNVEGDLVSLIQSHGFKSDYIILNAAGYTHTSVAIPDAVAAIPAQVVGVHVSNIYQREEVRHIDLFAKYCVGCLFGFGLEGYKMALTYITNIEDDK